MGKWHRARSLAIRNVEQVGKPRHALKLRAQLFGCHCWLVQQCLPEVPRTHPRDTRTTELAACRSMSPLATRTLPGFCATTALMNYKMLWSSRNHLRVFGLILHAAIAIP